MLLVPTLQRMRPVALISLLKAFRETYIIWFGVQLDANLRVRVRIRLFSEWSTNKCVRGLQIGRIDGGSERMKQFGPIDTIG